MDVKVNIEFKDEFGTITRGKSETLGYEPLEDTHLEAVVDHFRQALLACGFSVDNVTKIKLEDDTAV